MLWKFERFCFVSRENRLLWIKKLPSTVPEVWEHADQAERTPGDPRVGCRAGAEGKGTAVCVRRMWEEFQFAACEAVSV